MSNFNPKNEYSEVYEPPASNNLGSDYQKELWSINNIDGNIAETNETEAAKTSKFALAKDMSIFVKAALATVATVGVASNLSTINDSVFAFPSFETTNDSISFDIELYQEGDYMLFLTTDFLGSDVLEEIPEYLFMQELQKGSYSFTIPDLVSDSDYYLSLCSVESDTYKPIYCETVHTLSYKLDYELNYEIIQNNQLSYHFATTDEKSFKLLLLQDGVMVQEVLLNQEADGLFSDLLVETAYELLLVTNEENYTKIKMYSIEIPKYYDIGIENLSLSDNNLSFTLQIKEAPLNREANALLIDVDGTILKQVVIQLDENQMVTIDGVSVTDGMKLQITNGNKKIIYCEKNFPVE